MIGHLLNRTVTVWREERTETGSGGWTTEWVDKGSRKVRVSQPSAAERLVADRAGAALDAHVYAAHDADIGRGDQLRSSGETYRVTATISPSVPGVYLRADCEHIQTQKG